MERVAKRAHFYPARFGVDVTECEIEQPLPRDNNSTTTTTLLTSTHIPTYPYPVAASQPSLDDLSWSNVFLQSTSDPFQPSPQGPLPSLPSFPSLPSLVYPGLPTVTAIDAFLPLWDQQRQQRKKAAPLAPSAPSMPSALFLPVGCVVPAVPSTRGAEVTRASGLADNPQSFACHVWPQVSNPSVPNERFLGFEPLTSQLDSVPRLQDSGQFRRRAHADASKGTPRGIDQVNACSPLLSLELYEATENNPLAEGESPGEEVQSRPPLTISEQIDGDEDWCALKAFLSEPLPSPDTDKTDQTQPTSSSPSPLSLSLNSESTRQQHGVPAPTLGCRHPNLGVEVSRESNGVPEQVNPPTATVPEAPACDVEPTAVGFPSASTEPPTVGSFPAPSDTQQLRQRQTHPRAIEGVSKEKEHKAPSPTLLPHSHSHSGLPISQGRPNGPRAGEVGWGQVVPARQRGVSRVDPVNARQGQVNARQGGGRAGPVEIPRTKEGEVMPSHVRGAMFRSWMHIGLQMWDMGVTLGLDNILHALVLGERSTYLEGQSSTATCQLEGQSPVAPPSPPCESPGQNPAARCSEKEVLSAKAQGGGMAKDSPSLVSNLPEALVQRIKTAAHTSKGKGKGNALSPVLNSEKEKQMQVCKSGGEGGSQATPPVPLSQRLACTLGAIQAQKLRKRKQEEMDNNETGCTAEEGPKGHYTALAVAQGIGTLKGFGALKGIGTPKAIGSLKGIGTPRVVLARPDAVGMPAGSRTPLEGSCVRQEKLLLPVPQPAVPQALERTMKQRLLMAAAALESGNKDAFFGLCSQLESHANKKGSPAQRFAHWMLKSLHLREQGGVYDYLQNASNAPVKDLHNAYMWYCTSTPLVPFSVITSISMLVPRLLGHSNVHLINIGDTFLPHVPTLMRLLVAYPEVLRLQQTLKGEEASRKGLRKFRLTSINYGSLLRPERREVKTVKARSEIDVFLRDVAESLGLGFECQILDIDELNVSSLGGVIPRRGEVVGVCASISFKYAHDEAPILALQETLKCLKRVNPVVIAFSEEDCDGSSRDFVPRFSSVMDYTWARLDWHDAVVSPCHRSNLMRYEQFWFAPNLFKTVSCERRDRRVRPRSNSGWKDAFVSAGFNPVSIPYPLLEGALGLIKSYPMGFELSVVEESLVLYWKGYPVAFASAFVP